MTRRGFTAEFTGERDARVKGLARLLTVAELADGMVSVKIEGESPISANLGFVTLHAAVHTAADWAVVKGFMVPADFKVVRGKAF